MRKRVASSRKFVAEGYRPSSVARVAGITRQAIYRTPKPGTAPESRKIADETEDQIVKMSEANSTDG